MNLYKSVTADGGMDGFLISQNHMVCHSWKHKQEGEGNLTNQFKMEDALEGKYMKFCIHLYIYSYIYTCPVELQGSHLRRQSILSLRGPTS